jgi:hypothetical protein
MPDCDYCEESFADEDDYLAHLAADHEGDLSAIDQRRVESVSDDSGFDVPVGPLVLVGFLIFAAASVAWVVFFGLESGGGAPSLSKSGDDAVISQVETEPSEGRQHIDPEADAEYERVPPTSGPHYPPGQETAAGFYEEPQPYERLVHSLEHGAVVVYYDPAKLTDDAEQRLQEWGNTYTGSFMSFIAVPNPEDDPEATYVLTAWEKRLTLESYDQDAVKAFASEYLGRGPEGGTR